MKQQMIHLQRLEELSRINIESLSRTPINKNTPAILSYSQNKFSPIYHERPINESLKNSQVFSACIPNSFFEKPYEPQMDYDRKKYFETDNESLDSLALIFYEKMKLNNISGNQKNRLDSKTDQMQLNKFKSYSLNDFSFSSGKQENEKYYTDGANEENFLNKTESNHYENEPNTDESKLIEDLFFIK